MTISVNQTFEDAIASGTLKVAELYDVKLYDGTTYYYTTHSEDIKWGNPSVIYKALPITRETIEHNINLEMDIVTVSIQNISGDLYDLVQRNVLDAVVLTIKRINWTDSYAADLETVMFVGTGDIEFNRSVLKIVCKSILNSLNVRIPRPLYQEPCNHALFDSGCQLEQSNYKFTGTVNGVATDRFSVIDSDIQMFGVPFDAGSSVNPFSIGDAMTGDIAGVAVVTNVQYSSPSDGQVWYNKMGAQFIDDEVISGPAGVSDIVVNGAPAENTQYYEMGEIKITSGNNEGQRRMVRSSSSGVLVSFTSFPKDIANGVSYELYPGCDKRVAETCDAVFNNSLNFLGFIHIPKVQETL